MTNGEKFREQDNWGVAMWITDFFNGNKEKEGNKEFMNQIHDWLEQEFVDGNGLDGNNLDNK